MRFKPTCAERDALRGEKVSLAVSLSLFLSLSVSLSLSRGARGDFDERTNLRTEEREEGERS